MTDAEKINRVRDIIFLWASMGERNIIEEAYAAAEALEAIVDVVGPYEKL